MTDTSDQDEASLTPEELRFLKRVADDYRSGRRLACFVFRAIISLGALGAAVVGILSGLHALGYGPPAGGSGGFP